MYADILHRVLTNRDMSLNLELICHARRNLDAIGTTRKLLTYESAARVLAAHAFDVIRMKTRDLNAAG